MNTERPPLGRRASNETEDVPVERHRGYSDGRRFVPMKKKTQINKERAQWSSSASSDHGGCPIGHPTRSCRNGGCANGNAVAPAGTEVLNITEALK